MRVGRGPQGRREASLETDDYEWATRKHSRKCSGWAVNRWIARLEDRGEPNVRQ
jgi:hypothetical protein